MKDFFIDFMSLSRLILLGPGVVCIPSFICGWPL